VHVAFGISPTSYFVLPTAMRWQLLQAEMAALAIRASDALTGGHDGLLVSP
jgi:hypothetical protein